MFETHYSLEKHCLQVPKMVTPPPDKNNGPSTLKLGKETAKTNLKKDQLFAESVKRNFGIESHLFWKSHFDLINKFVEAHTISHH